MSKCKFPPCKFVPRNNVDRNWHNERHHGGRKMDPLKRAQRERDLYRAKLIDELIENRNLDRVAAAFEADSEIKTHMGIVEKAIGGASCI